MLISNFVNDLVFPRVVKRSAIYIIRIKLLIGCFLMCACDLQLFAKSSADDVLFYPIAILLKFDLILLVDRIHVYISKTTTSIVFFHTIVYWLAPISCLKSKSYMKP